MRLAWKSALIKVHLYAGLVPAVFVMLIGVSGGVLMLERGIVPLPSDPLRTVEPAGERVPIDPVLDRIETLYAKAPQQLVIYADPTRPDQYRMPGGSTVFVDPYTGSLLGREEDRRRPFFAWMRKLHTSLLLGEFGRWVVGLSTAVLLMSLVTGLAIGIIGLNRRNIRQRLSLRWTGQGRSWNHRFHHLMGLLMGPVLLAIALSGCFIAFQPVQDSLLTLMSGSPRLGADTHPRPTSAANRKPISADAALDAAGVIDNGQRMTFVRFPQAADDVFHVHASPSREHWFVDPYSGDLLDDPYAQQRVETEEARFFVRGFHFGSVYGRPTQWVWMVASFIIPVFVISGWWIQRSKGRRPQRTRVRQSRPAEREPVDVEPVGSQR